MVNMIKKESNQIKPEKQSTPTERGPHNHLTIPIVNLHQKRLIHVSIAQLHQINRKRAEDGFLVVHNGLRLVHVDPITTDIRLVTVLGLICV
jgi:hypothetical protein